MPLGREVRLGPGDIVLDGVPAPLPKTGAQHPNFSAHVYCDQTASWIKMPLGTEVRLSRANIVLDGDTATPSPKKDAQPPQFYAHVYCGQTTVWIKMPLGMEVGLSPGDTVLDGKTDPLKRDTAPPPTICGLSTVAKRSPISATAEHLL